MSIAATPSSTSPASNWTQRYGQRHRLERVATFPTGIVSPRRVRIYRRTGHYVLQWWEPQARANASERVNGDLIDAVARSRQIEQRLTEFRRSGHARVRLGHGELVEHFVADLGRRAAAGELAPRTVVRYQAALRHYLDFAAQPAISGIYRYATAVDRRFALEFAAYLNAVQTARNGHANAPKRKMQGIGFVLDTIRALYLWAADPDRGGHLPDGFRNPFLRNGVPRRVTTVDPTAEPDITTEMAAQFLKACDQFQRRLFAVHILCGLRAAEPVYLFHELIADGWLNVPCLPQLGYMTKGHRNKRLPLLPELQSVLCGDLPEPRQGLLFVRRDAAAGRAKTPLDERSLDELAQVYERQRGHDHASQVSAREAVLRAAGALNYDLIQGEFRRVAGRLGWPPSATLKDFRHLFSTALANGGVPEHERLYLMGHAPDKRAIVAYTHLNRLAEHYRAAVQQELGAVVGALRELPARRHGPG